VFGLFWNQQQETDSEYQAKFVKTFQGYYNRCVSLSLHFVTEDRHGKQYPETKKGEGQAFIVKKGQQKFMVTVKHNFCSEVNQHGEYEQCFFVTSILPHATTSVCITHDLVGWKFDENAQEKFEPTGWKYGKELVVMPLVEQYFSRLDTLRDAVECFETVSPKFHVEKDMQVGIMAHSNNGTLAANMKRCLSSKGYEAKKGDVFITVGKITAVGEDHIQYDVNTVPGFSGAPVFLLAPGENHDMKIIAVHAGFSNEAESNFGFLVSPEILDSTTASDH